MGNKFQKQRGDELEQVSRPKRILQKIITTTKQFMKQTQKQQQNFEEHENLLLFEQPIITRISVFLNLKDIRLLRCCNLRLFSQLSFDNQKSGLASNFISQNISLRQTQIFFNDSIKNSIKVSLNQISISTTSNWIEFYQWQLEVKKQWIFLNELRPKSDISLTPPNLQHEYVNYCATSSFQKKALMLDQAELKKNVEEYDHFLMKDSKSQSLAKNLVSCNIQELIKVKQEILANKSYCSMRLQKTYLIYLQMINQCQFFKQLLDEATELEDNQGFLNLYSLCWRQFSEQTIQCDKPIGLYLDSLSEFFEKGKKLTLTDLVIQIWINVVLVNQNDNQISAYLVTSFVKLSLEFRTVNIIEGIDKNFDNTIRASSIQNTMNTLSNFFQALCDVSCQSNMVKWIGHSDNFVGIDQLQECLEAVIQQCSLVHKFCLEDFADDFDQIFKVISHDLEGLRLVLGLWVTELNIEQIHLDFQRTHMKNSLQKENIQFDISKLMLDDEKDQIHQSFYDVVIQSPRDQIYKSLTQTYQGQQEFQLQKTKARTQSAIVQSNITGYNNKKQDLLEQIIKVGIKEFQIEWDGREFNPLRRSSDNSTQTSGSHIGSFILGSSVEKLEQFDNDLTAQISKYVKINYNSISDKVFEHQQSLLKYNLESRNRDIESYYNLELYSPLYYGDKVEFKPIKMINGSSSLTSAQIVLKQ